MRCADLGRDPVPHRLVLESESSISVWLLMFRFSVEESPKEQKWIVQGRLSGAFARELGVNWQTSVDRDPNCLRIVDLREVIFIDRCGEDVLRKMICQHAKFLASGVYTEHLLEELQSGHAEHTDD